MNCIKAIAVSMLLACSQAAIAASSYTLAHASGQSPVGSYIEMKADFIAVPILLSSSEKDPEIRLRELNESKEMLAAEIKKNSNMDLLFASVALSASETSSYGSRYDSNIQLYITRKLTKDTDVYKSVAEISDMTDRMNFRGDVVYNLGQGVLGIINPEQFRPALIQKIAQEIKTVKKEVGVKSKVIIKGLQGNINAVERNDDTVQLFINYRLEFDEI